MVYDKLPQGCRLIELPVYTDDRGSLSFGEGGDKIPFPINRIFWIHDVPQGKTRGGHAHWICAEVVFPVCGSFDMMVDDGETRTTVTMDRSNVGILIPAGVWCELSNFAPGTVCVVVASHPYNTEGYVNEYSAYLKDSRRLKIFDSAAK